MAILIKDHNSIFVHVPKTGGTSIQYWLQKHTVCELTKGSKHDSYKQHVQKYGDFDFSFAVVRNPWDWCVSWYYFKKDRALRRLNNHKNKGKFTKQHNENVIAEFNRGFDYFVEHTTLKGQLHLVQGVDYIVKFEDLDAGLETVANRLDIPLDIGYTNFSSRTDKDYKSYYNNNTRDIIEKKFKKDIEAFGYNY